MKTTKKGFTLIELIVVIAIIGVLAAILVPTMLGYVKKSKISSANTTASSIYKAVNSALTELDEEGCDIGGDYRVYCAGSGATWSNTVCLTGSLNQTASDYVADNMTQFGSKVKNFFADIDKVKKGTAAYIKNGTCVAIVSAVDSTYTGTYPSGFITSDNYATYSIKDSVTCNSVLDDLVADKHLDC